MEKTESFTEIIFRNKIYSPILFILWEKQDEYSLGIPNSILRKEYCIKIGKEVTRRWINKILNDLIKLGIVNEKGNKSILFYSIEPSISVFLSKIKKDYDINENLLKDTCTKILEKRKNDEKSNNPWLVQKNAYELFLDNKKAEKSIILDDKSK